MNPLFKPKTAFDFNQNRPTDNWQQESKEKFPEEAKEAAGAPLNMSQYGNPACSKCGQPIGEGQMVNWEGGVENHVTCPPKQQDQGWQSRIMMPKKPQPGAPGAQPTGQRPQQPQVQQQTRQYSSASTPWDVYLNGKWINRVYTEPGFSIEMVKQSLVNHDAYNPAIEVTPGTSPVPGSVPLNRIGSVEKVGIRKKYGGSHRPSVAFGVPSESSHAVAMALAEAGIKDFEVATDYDINASYFSFPTAEEKEVATQLIAEKFAPQIASGKGLWGGWQKQVDPTIPDTSRVPISKMNAEKKAGQWGERSYDSDQVHDILDEYRLKLNDPGGQKSKGFDQPVDPGHLPTLYAQLERMFQGNVGDDTKHALGVVVFLATHGADTLPKELREIAANAAEAYLNDDAYLGEWKDPVKRKNALAREVALLRAGNVGKLATSDDDLEEGGVAVYEEPDQEEMEAYDDARAQDRGPAHKDLTPEESDLYDESKYDEGDTDFDPAVIERDQEATVPAPQQPAAPPAPEPEEVAVEEAPPQTKKQPAAPAPADVKEEEIGDFSAKEIATRRPKSVGAELSNKPGQYSNWAAIEQADKDRPRRKTQQGKPVPGYKDKLAATVIRYSGVKYTAAEMKDPDKVLNKFINHVRDNLIWLYNQVPEQLREKTKKWYDSAHRLTNQFAQQYGFTPEQVAGVTAALSPQNPWDNNIGLTKRMLDIYKNHQNSPWTPEMDVKVKELAAVPTQSRAFKAMLRDIRGKTFGQVVDANPDVQATKRALWIRLYDEAYNSPINEAYAPDGTVSGESPDMRSWIGLDHLAKAVKILDNGDIENINAVMGHGHKIRNFYNNIINPNSKAGHVTIDTHAVAAGMLSPFGAKDLEATHNFGGTLVGTPGAPKNSATGLQGTYPLYAEAYQRAAAKLGVKPRQLQSVTWEAIKSLMGDEKKTNELKDRVKTIWEDVQDGRLTVDQARDMIANESGGFAKPQWMPDEEWERLGTEGGDTSFNVEGA